MGRAGGQGGAAQGAWTRPAAAGTPVAFTLSDGFCVDRHRAEFLELVEHRVDILFANEVEICSLYEVDDFEEAARAGRRATATSPA